LQIYGNAFKFFLTAYFNPLKDFSLWFTEGLWHIADLKAYDHILFLLVLFGGFALKEWKKTLWLITAFTIGHSITLALSVLELVKIKTSWVEFLIPCTIMVTALLNLLTLNRGTRQSIWLNFLMVIFFGLIHGLGFSVLLRSLLGKETDITVPLLSFNLGIEAGQILIIGIIALVSLIMINMFRITHKGWRSFVSAAAFGIAFIMAMERL
jgi:hypothetical protein